MNLEKKKRSSRSPDPVFQQFEQYVILDTNILSHSLDSRYRDQIEEHFRELNKKGFGLALSKITRGELLSNKSLSQETEAIEILNKFPNQYEITNEVLDLSGRLLKVYTHQGNLEGRTIREINLPDRIIAATAMLTGSIIMTENVGDFPLPFFHEDGDVYIEANEGSIKKVRAFLFLKPDVNFINQRLSEAG